MERPKRVVREVSATPGRSSSSSSNQNGGVPPTAKFQLGEADTSWLIGGIVEKGVVENPLTNPPSAPVPTVLPFPVARHRSHGPPWGPVPKQMPNDEEVEKEDEDGHEYDSVAAYAKPVSKKERKGLDFSQLQKLIAEENKEGNVTLLKESEKRKSRDEQVDDVKYASPKINLVQDIGIQKSNGRRVDEVSCDSSICNLASVDMEIDSLNRRLPHLASVDMEIDRQLGGDKTSYLNDSQALPQATKNMDFEFREEKEQATSIPSVVSSSGSSYTENQYGSMTLENEIDGENSARLRGMSTNEIEEARLEIMEKMNPAVLEALRKRGQKKLKEKKEAYRADRLNNSESSSQRSDDQDKFVSSSADNGHSNRAINTVPSSKQCGLENESVSSTTGSSSSWEIWRARVEAVRHLRFSVDGNVVELDNSPLLGQNTSHAEKYVIGVAERDFIRTEGDPAGIGYTIVEATELTRSTFPAQRAAALHLLASVLRTALHNIHKNKSKSVLGIENAKSFTDWEAIWAFALGPEPKLVLALRLCLDDSHTNVLLACLNVIHCALSCDENENFSNLSEKMALFEKSICTAPVFRRKPEVDGGFLQGGFWKYSAKPSNITPYEEVTMVNEMAEADHKIQDDLYFAGQDFAGGLIRMGILPRATFLIENNYSVVLEEGLISILIAIARHSPKSSSAVMNCPGLVQTIVSRYVMDGGVDISSTKVKSVTLLKVLAQSEKKNCMLLIKNWNFRKMTWQLYKFNPSIDHWMKSGKDNCKLLSALMAEQLRFWKVCIQYGYCISDFPEIFPALCLWLHPPSFRKLLDVEMCDEVALISMEVFHVLGALAQRLPNLFLQNLSEKPQDISDDGTEYWSWNHVGPIVDLALKWLAIRSDPNIAAFFASYITDGTDYVKGDHLSTFLWVISAVLHMLYVVLARIVPDNNSSKENDGYVPWLPEFVPKIGLQLLQNDFFSLSDFSGRDSTSDLAGGSSMVDCFLNLRRYKEGQTPLASVSCIYWLIQIVIYSDTLIQAARRHLTSSIVEPNLPGKDRALAEGVFKCSRNEFEHLLTIFKGLNASGWHALQSVEKFGRGGPAPGVGFGWGACGGGFWCENVILVQADSRVLICLLELFGIAPDGSHHTKEEMTSLDNINSVVTALLTLGPRDENAAFKALHILLQVPVLKCLNHFIRQFTISFGGLKPFCWEYLEEDFTVFSRILTRHFKTRWLCKKSKKLKVLNENISHQSALKENDRLETIPEEVDALNSQPTSLIAEWANMNMPLPLHWFLSPISTITTMKGGKLQNAANSSDEMFESAENGELIRSGLFFLLGMEATSYFVSPGIGCPIQSVPLIWKLHSLSVVLLSGMNVLGERSKDVYETLQDMYGQFLDKSKDLKSDDLVLDKNENLGSGKKHEVENLRFQSNIHDSYPTFIESLVEQFAALSYGDLSYGRQIAIYLRRDVESSVRLSAWKELSGASILELLPPIGRCIGAADGYLEPVEENERVLEAYVKSWESGTLDKAAVHGSVAFTLALHHLSSFIFLQHPGVKPLLRNKVVKALLRDFCRKKRHQDMMLQLIQYNKPSTTLQQDLSQHSVTIERRLEIITEACEGNMSLLKEVDKLKILCL